MRPHTLIYTHCYTQRYQTTHLFTGTHTHLTHTHLTHNTLSPPSSLPSENKPKNGGICVANHTTPIDVIILANDGCYSMVPWLCPSITLVDIGLFWVYSTIC